MLLQFQILVLFLASSVHPFHITVCEIEHDPETKALQISQRVFLDDLEETLNHVYSTKMDIIQPEDKHLRDSLIKEYIIKNLILTVDGKKRDRTYLGHEVDKDVLWCYIEYYGVKKLEKISLTNTVFFELYEDQNTLVHVTYEGTTVSRKLTQLKPSEEFIFKK